MIAGLQRANSAGIFFLCLAILPSVSQAGIQFSVSMDTSSLVGQSAPPAPFYLEFQLNDGSGTNDGNNTVTLTNFLFVGGAASGAPNLTGGASGDLSSSVTITDSQFFNEFYQAFAPGSSLTFDVDLSTNLDIGLTPDQFSFAILYTDAASGELFEIPTLGPVNTFLSVDINSANPPIGAHASDPNSAPTFDIPAPDVQLMQGAVPEPSTLALFVGLAVVGWISSLRRHLASAKRTVALA